MSDLPAAAQRAAERAAEIRQDIHRHPEIAYTETRTAGVICDELTALGIEHRTGLAGGTGVLAHLPGGDGPPVALRADMDALPITERTGKPYASTNEGVMHACGHDGHTAILLGTAAVLNTMTLPRPVTLVFQPAEEGGAGGKRMVEDGALDGSVLGPKVEEIFGLHCWPEERLGCVGTIPGPMLAATDELNITITGAQAHAAAPHTGVDPIVAAAHVVTALQAIVSRNTDPLDACVVTVGMFSAGSAPNVIPESATLRGTIRTLTPEQRVLARTRVTETAQRVAQGLGCTAEVNLVEGYPVTHNNADLAARVHTIAERALGAPQVTPVARPIMGGEDFSFYGDHARACFFFLGLCPEGETYPLVHTPEFDFNDDALATGIEMMVRCATEA